MKEIKMSHNKYYGTGLPTFTHRTLNKHLRKGSRRGQRRDWNEQLITWDGPDSSLYIRSMKRRKGNPAQFNALDALEVYMGPYFYGKPCRTEFIRALCSMLSPQVARALYFRATGRYGNFRKGSGIYHALGREVHDWDSFLKRHFLPVLRNAVRG